MIIGIGIDCIDINRFEHWHTYDNKRLLRLFSPEEIDYCRSSIAHSSARFAVRFAAREALYKAMSQIDPMHTIPFLTLCRATRVINESVKAPFLKVDYDFIKNYCITSRLTHANLLLSLTHAKKIAAAVVIIES